MRKKKCAKCGDEMPPMTKEEERESLEELEKNFKGFLPEECEVVCDSCYEEILNSLNN